MPTIPVITRDYQLSEWRFTGEGNPWSTNVTTNLDVSVWSDALVRNKNPLWKDQLKKGVDASTAYRRTGTDVTILPLLIETRAVGSYPYDTRGVFAEALLNVHPVRVPTDTTVRDQALARVKRRIASLEESFQSLIPLAELRESRQLIHEMINLTDRIVRVIADLKRTKGKSLFRFVQDAWLAYSFGINPLIGDLKNLGDAMWAYLTKGDVRDRVQGTMGKDWFSQTSGDSITGVLGMPIRYVGVAHHRLSYRYAAGWKFLIRSSNDYSALKHFGVTVPHLVPALWETTAFSWVLDYFTTIGDWLDDVFVGQAGQSIYVIEDRKYQYSSKLYLEHYLNPGVTNTVLKHRKGWVKVEYFDFERTPLTALPSRTLRWRTIDEIGLHSLNKLLNLTSLVWRTRRWDQI